MGAVGVASAQLAVSVILLAWNVAFAVRKLGMMIHILWFGMVII